ncbi:S8 family serine peptidase [Methyloglobulus sp.]|jgi:subtilisin family serine protease|uniref:S8 family peptidase n=1 Tax=Methyloglobulus sp. TaxID=2518622 RepID=UPI0032B809A7
MRIYLLLALLGLTIFSTPSQSKNATDSKSGFYSLLDQRNADRLLLVTFSDNTINSIKGTASPTSYRRRGDYRSSTWSERVANQLADDYGLEKLAEWPMSEVGAQCVVYKVSDKTTVVSAIERLSKDDRVDIVQSMNVFKTKAQSYNDPYFKLQTNLQQMQIGLAHGRATGQDIIIGMIDTGVDLDHPDLAGQISKNQNFAKDISASFSTDKHGTAVAGVMVARRDNAKGIIGVAPNAKLVVLKACWPDKADAIEAICNSFTLALAINTAIKTGVDVLNMSLTGPQDPLLTLLLNKAIANGIIVVAADTGFADSVESFPASLKDVISVQSIKQPVSVPDSLAESVAAPGDKILTTLPHGTYDFISGSSIAAAEVSGVIALLLELKQDLTVAEVHTILHKSKVMPKGGIIAGVNANVAVNALCETVACSQSVVSVAQRKPL